MRTTPHFPTSQTSIACVVLHQELKRLPKTQGKVLACCEGSRSFPGQAAPGSEQQPAVGDGSGRLNSHPHHMLPKCQPGTHAAGSRAHEGSKCSLAGTHSPAQGAWGTAGCSVPASRVQEVNPGLSLVVRTAIRCWRKAEVTLQQSSFEPMLRIYWVPPYRRHWVKGFGGWTIPGRLKEKKSKQEGWQNKQASHLKSKHIQNPPPLKEILPAACPAALCLQQLQWQALQSLICMSGRAPEANRLEIWRHCSRRSCCKRALPRASRIFKCQSGRELAEEMSRGAAQAAESWVCWAEL